MADDLEQLAELAANLRKLDSLGAEIAEEALPAVLEEATRTAAAGTTAEGEAWKPRKAGGRALANAASAITATVSGATRAVLTLILRGPEVYHHLAKGNGKYGLPRRAVLFDPANGVPAKMREAIATAAARVVARRMGGAQ